MIEINELKLNDNNPRFIPDERFQKLKDSIEQFPKMMKLRPIVVDKQNIVLGGNMRLRALIDLGYKSIPGEWVKKADELNEEEKRRFIIADNTGFGEWDYELLANGWDAAELETWGMELPDEWGAEEPEAQDDGYEMPDEIEPDVKEGDLIDIGPHRLLCGDSTRAEDVQRLMNGFIADLVFTDPPHDVEQEEFIDFLQHFCNGTKFVLHNDLYLAKLAVKYQDRFERFFVHDFVFHIGGGNRFFSQNDLIACFDYSADKFVNLQDGFSTVIRKMTERQKGTKNLDHSHQKPVYVPFVIIAHFSSKENIVLDLYLGSGTTMVAAHQLNRICYGMEIDPKYCQVIIDRMHKLDPDLEIKINGEKYEPKAKEELT